MPLPECRHRQQRRRRTPTAAAAGDGRAQPPHGAWQACWASTSLASWRAPAAGSRLQGGKHLRAVAVLCCLGDGRDRLIASAAAAAAAGGETEILSNRCVRTARGGGVKHAVAPRD